VPRSYAEIVEYPSKTHHPILAELVSGYLADLAARGACAPTLKQKRLVLVRLVEKLPADPREVRAGDVVCAVQLLASTPGMYRVYRAAVVGFFGWLKRRGLFDADLAVELPGARAGGRPGRVVVEPFLT